MAAAFDRSDILRTIQLFYEPGDVMELRVLNAGKFRTVSGYFDHAGAMVDAVVALADEPFPAYYFCLNPVRPDLFARSANKYTRYAKETTADADIIKRRWLPIDLDPIRPAGISSNEEEHQAALQKALDIREWLISRGWPASAFILADSGNGGHLAVKIDLPNDEETRDLVKSCLEALDAVFSDDKVKVDGTTYNAARIWKIYGTMARKGSDTPDRPHRLAKIIDAPVELATVSREQLEALAAIRPAKEQSATTQNSQKGADFDPVRYAEAHGATVAKVKKGWVDPKGKKWTLAILEECPFNADHNRGEAWVGVADSGERGFGCPHESCKGNNWQTLKQLWSPAPETEPAERTPTAGIARETAIIGLDALTKAVGKMEQIDPDTGDKVLDETGRPVMIAKRVLSPSKAANATITSMPLMLSEVDAALDKAKIWRYDGGIWKPDGEREIIKTIDAAIGDLSYEKGLRETLRRVRSQIDITAFDCNAYLFPARDGVIDLTTGAFREARPEDYLTFCYDAEVNRPGADYRPFLWFLCSALPDPRDVLTCLDIITAIAIRIPFEIIVLLFGGGSNGKGIFEKVILALFTMARSTAIKLEEIKKSRFGPGTLLNKDVWIVTEVETVKDAMSVLKAEATGEMIDTDTKYGGRTQGIPHAMAILDANNPFDFGDDSHGRKRRVVKLDFPYKFDDAEGTRPIDRQLLEKLTQPEVLSGITKIIAARAPELIRSRRIYRRKSIEEQEDEYKRQQFSLATFCDECITDAPPYDIVAPKKLRVDGIYSEYLEYCRLFHVPTPAAKVPFGKYIRERYGVQSVSTTESVNGVSTDFRYYPGIFLNKTARTVFAEIKISYTDSTDRTPTDIRQIWDIGNGICRDSPTDPTEELISGVLSEIERMFKFISSCQNERDIRYENYLKSSVGTVGKEISTLTDSDFLPTEGEISCRNPVGESVGADESPSKQEYKTILILEDVPIFVGVDDRNYLLHRQDVAHIPAIHARNLIAKHLAREIHVGLGPHPRRDAPAPVKLDEAAEVGA